MQVLAKKTTIEVFDPPMCCSTGVCSPEPDDRLAQFSADLDWLNHQGIAAPIPIASALSAVPTRSWWRSRSRSASRVHYSPKQFLVSRRRTEAVARKPALRLGI